MQWVTTYPLTLEHAAVVWLVRRFIDPDADLMLTGADIAAFSANVEALGPTTKLRPFLRRYPALGGRTGERVEADVRRAQQEHEQGKAVRAWSPALADALIELCGLSCDLGRLLACFDRQFGDGASQRNLWAEEVVAAMPIGAMVLNGAGGVLTVNPRVAEYLAMTPARLLGSNIEAVPLEWVDRRGNPVSRFSALVSAAAQHRRSYDRILARSPADLFLATSIVPMTARKAEDARLLVTCVDVTDQTLLEQALEDSEQRVHYVLNTLPYGVLEFNPSGEIMYANSALHRMFDYPAGALLGMPSWFTKGEGFDGSPVRDRYLSMIDQRQQPQPYISRVISRTREEFEVRVDWSYRFDGNGQAMGFIATLTNLTQDALRRTEFARFVTSRNPTAT